MTALGQTMRNHDLRRAQASFAASWTSEWALTVIVGVVAYGDGGAALVGIVAALRMALPAFVSPFASALADRKRRDRVLVFSGLVRAVVTALAALLLAVHGPLPVFYGLIVLASCAFILVRSANSALVPLLCRSPLELTSAMASRGLLDSASTLVGPLLAALVLGVSTPAVAVVAVALLSAASSAVLLGLTYEVPARVSSTLSARAIATEAAAGFRVLREEHDAALLVALALVQTFIRGCLTVFIVVLAFTVLHTGEEGVGLLTAAIGAGATAGSVAAFSLVSGRRLAAVGGGGITLWGLPLVVSSAVSSTPGLVALMAAVGVGNSLLDFGFFTLLVRLVPEGLLGRLFGVFESLVALAVALGSLVAPLLIDRLGLPGALLLVGLLAPVAVLLALPRLLHIDRTMGRRDEEIDVLRRVGMFQPLPMPVIDHLATVVGRAHVDAGADVFHQGDEGDFLYVIEHGTADVIGDGRLIRELQSGACFGEVALLNSSPRTATVRAHSELDLYTLGRADFLLAVTGCSATGHEAQVLMHERLEMFAPAPPVRGG
ncbi:MAG TPA: cyclic nucleotide-binding domain-containing protein [Candidatus Dormibacteraeota bacterium]